MAKKKVSSSSTTKTFPTPAAALLPPPPEFMTLDQLAVRWQKDRSSIWRMINEEKILPAYNLAATARRASWRVRLADILAHEDRVRIN